MQVFANGKRRFYSLMEFSVIHLKYQGVKNWSQYHFKCNVANRNKIFQEDIPP